MRSIAATGPVRRIGALGAPERSYRTRRVAPGNTGMSADITYRDPSGPHADPTGDSSVTMYARVWSGLRTSTVVGPPLVLLLLRQFAIQPCFGSTSRPASVSGRGTSPPARPTPSDATGVARPDAVATRNMATTLPSCG